MMAQIMLRFASLSQAWLVVYLFSETVTEHGATHLEMLRKGYHEGTMHDHLSPTVRKYMTPRK